MINIPFNKPYLTGKETYYIRLAVKSGKLSGNGKFTAKCHQFFQEKYNFLKCLLTTSCTDALEMTSLLMDIQPGDEIIVPSYTFVSTANCFVLRGAKIIFADSYSNNPNIDPDGLVKLITPKTKAIIVVHYAGIACDMDEIMSIANKYNLFVVEDAAQAINSFYKGKPLGGIGHFGTFSFHETKNIISGEGGMLVINDKKYISRAEIIWDKGTNRTAFFRGEVDKYGWVDIGSSFLPSEIIAAFLYAQLENLKEIQSARKKSWNYYYQSLKQIAIKCKMELPQIPEYATNNSHIFYLICNSLDERTNLIHYLKSQGILSVFHYLSLHSSPYYFIKHGKRELRNSDHFSDCLVRLPLYYELTIDEQSYIIDSIIKFYKSIYKL